MNPKILIPVLASVAALSAVFFALSTRSTLAVADGARPLSERIAHGQHLVSTAGCHDCHTPFKPTADGAEADMTRMLSGHPAALEMPPPPAPSGPWLVSVAGTNTAWSGPWGVSFTANLTPDAETGLGRWSEATFIRTIRTGRHMGQGRKILPPMPIPVYRNFSDEELGDIFAYLRSIPAIHNRVPTPLAPAAATAAATPAEVHAPEG